MKSLDDYNVGIEQAGTRHRPVHTSALSAVILLKCYLAATLFS